MCVDRFNAICGPCAYGVRPCAERRQITTAYVARAADKMDGDKRFTSLHESSQMRKTILDYNLCGFESLHACQQQGGGAVC